MHYFCCDDQRLQVIRDGVTVGGLLLNAIDYLDVDTSDQRILRVHFVHALASNGLDKSNVVIEGGERITGIQVTEAKVNATDSTILDVKVEVAGDFSTYVLKLVNTDPKFPLDGPPAGFDTQLSAIPFSFKANCPSNFDCQTSTSCSVPLATTPDIDYLAKDFGSFRQLILSRMGALVPQWSETSAADLAVALAELLAYVGDYLSYRQDAVATEAYLGTARRRISVRRHARLLDYSIDEGSNARTWVCFECSAPVTIPAGTQILTGVPGMPPVMAVGSLALQNALATTPEVFETMYAASLDPARNSIPMYTWGATECCLPRGATSATLRYPPDGASAPALAAGDILILEERVSPATGLAADADVTHRHAVCLLSASRASDPIGGRFDDPPNSKPVQLTEVTWAAADALPFPLCISAKADVEHRQGTIREVSVARGNVILADHGQTITGEALGQVPQSTIQKAPAPGQDRCAGAQPEWVPPRFFPRLQRSPVTQAAPLKLPPVSAAAAVAWLSTDTVPQVKRLDSILGKTSQVWGPAEKDLLSSAPERRDFVVEVETGGTAYIRFGDGEYGARPTTGAVFSATYRVGNGVEGNVGAEALAHLATADPAILSGGSPVITALRNPLPASGGVEPESLEHVRQNAPAAFTVEQRAVTAADYAAITERRPDVQQAAATIRWTGSWQTAFVSVDRKGGLPVDQQFKDDMIAYLDPFRMAGRDVEIESPVFVSLELAITVCVMPDYVRTDVESVLLAVLGSGTLSDGTPGFFNSGNFSFGQPVYLSAIYAAAQSIEGVSFVSVTTFQRQGLPDTTALVTGTLAIGRLEIARLDNDPNFPEHGVLTLTMEGGR